MFDWELRCLSVIDQHNCLLKVRVECPMLIVRNCGNYLERAKRAIWNTVFEIY